MRGKRIGGELRFCSSAGATKRQQDEAHDDGQGHQHQDEPGRQELTAIRAVAIGLHTRMVGGQDLVRRTGWQTMMR